MARGKNGAPMLRLTLECPWGNILPMIVVAKMFQRSGERLIMDRRRSGRLISILAAFLLLLLSEHAPAAQTDSLAAQGTGPYSISSRATRPDETRVQIQAAVRIGSGGGFGQLYLPLSWRVGESD